MDNWLRRKNHGLGSDINMENIADDLYALKKGIYRYAIIQVKDGEAEGVVSLMNKVMGIAEKNKCVIGDRVSSMMLVYEMSGGDGQRIDGMIEEIKAIKESDKLKIILASGYGAEGNVGGEKMFIYGLYLNGTEEIFKKLASIPFGEILIDSK